MIEKIWNLEEKYVCKHKVGILFFIYKTDNPKDEYNSILIRTEINVPEIPKMNADNK
jgi:hypothetical protein